MGRLWRHQRPGRSGAPEIIILEEDKSLDEFRQMDAKAIVKALGAKAFVYSPYVLLRSLEVWKSSSQISIPDQIRERIEATYEERGQEDESAEWGKLDPGSWGTLFDETYAKGLSQKFLAARASTLWQEPLDDIEGVQTRLNEMPTVQLILCRRIDGHMFEFLDGSCHEIGKDDFRLACAQALHRNLVKVPRHLFDTVKSDSVLEPYLHGEFATGIASDDGIEVNGLRKGVRLRWSMEEGVIVEKDSTRSQE